MKYLTILFFIPFVTLAMPPEVSLDAIPDTGLDPTILRSRAKLTNEYIDQDFGAIKNTTKVNLTYAFGKPAQRDWNVQFDLPIVEYHAGDQSSLNDASGLGDIEVRSIHVFDGEDFFRWGAGAEIHFNSASKPKLGDGLFRISPAVAFALQPCKSFKFQYTVQYDQSITTDPGVPEQQKIKNKSAVQFDLPVDCYGYIENETNWNLQPGQTFSSNLKVEFGRAFGPRNEWVTSIRCEFPLTTSNDNYTLTAGLSYNFP